MQSSICAGNRPDQKLQHLWSNKNVKKGQDSLIPYHSSAHAKVTKVQMLGLPPPVTRVCEGRRGAKGQGGLISQLAGMVAAPEKKLTKLLIQGSQHDCFLPSFLALAPKLSTGNVQSSLTYHLMSL